MAFAGFGLYRGVWTYASIRDLVAVLKAVSTGSVAFAVLLLLMGFRRHSRATLVINWLLAVHPGGRHPPLDPPAARGPTAETSGQPPRC